jgi:hypothetical protein
MPPIIPPFMPLCRCAVAQQQDIPFIIDESCFAVDTDPLMCPWRPPCIWAAMVPEPATIARRTATSNADNFIAESP